jgi:hypothetical protein
VSFGEFVRRLTGAELSARAMAHSVNLSAQEAKQEARAALARLESVPRWNGPVELDARIKVIHGRETVAQLDGDFAAFAHAFERWIDELTAAERRS